MLSMKDLLYFSAGLGIGVGISLLVAPREGVSMPNLLRSRAFESLHNAARADQVADDYASHSATEDGMAEGPIQLRQ
jgi:hypothetical protein